MWDAARLMIFRVGTSGVTGKWFARDHHDIAVLIFAALHFETFEVVQGARSFSCLGGSLWISERESTGDIISNGAP